MPSTSFCSGAKDEAVNGWVTELATLRTDLAAKWVVGSNPIRAPEQVEALTPERRPPYARGTRHQGDRLANGASSVGCGGPGFPLRLADAAALAAGAGAGP